MTTEYCRGFLFSGDRMANSTKDKDGAVGCRCGRNNWCHRLYRYGLLYRSIQGDGHGATGREIADRDGNAPATGYHHSVAPELRADEIRQRRCVGTG